MKDSVVDIDYSLENYVNLSIRADGIGSLTEDDFQEALRDLATKREAANMHQLEAKDISPMTAEDMESLRVNVTRRWNDKPWYNIVGSETVESPKCMLQAHEVLALIAAAGAGSFQERVGQWLEFTFGESSDPLRKTRRAHRFTEESLEFVQSLGIPKDDVFQLVDYVYGRPVGEPAQEAGGVMVTLMGAASAHGLKVTDCAETELKRVWSKASDIRAKNARQVAGSPLPGASE